MYKVISIAFLITAALFAVAGMQEFRGSLQLSGADLTAYNEAVHPWINLAGTGGCLLLALVLWMKHPKADAPV